MTHRNTPSALMTVFMILEICAWVGCSAESPSSQASASASGQQAGSESSPPQVDLGSATEVASAASAGAASTATAAATETSAGTACSWPRFHGADGRNISSDTGLLAQWPEEGPPLAWKQSGIGMGFSGVTIGNGLIYTDGNIDDKTVVTALDLDGKIRWRAENGGAWTKDHQGSRGTPTIDGDRIYHESPLGAVICLNAQTGEKLWSVNILDEFGAKNIQWALAESLLVDGDHVICCPGGPKVSMAALDKRTGKPVWTAPSSGDDAGYASPILVEYQGLRILMTMNAKALIGVNADTGELLWRHEHVTSYDVNATMPLFHDGHVLISSGYGSGTELLKINVDGAKAGVERIWESKDLDNQHGGVILADGYVYGAAHKSNNSKWVCLEWKTGKMMYAERGVGMGSATLAEGMLYTMSERRDVGLIKATPDGHQLISKFKLPEGGDGPTWAHPVVCGGRLYLRHGDWLYAYDVRAK